jgi:hypothetical protein
MSDLLAMQPNLSIPLYIVAPDARRDLVVTQVNRPTFTRLPQSMPEVCRFIPFETLERRVAEIADLVQYLRPEFLDEISEACTIEAV